MRREGNKLVLTFEHTAGGLMSFDTQEVTGFTVAGADRQFVAAQAAVVEKDAQGKPIALEQRNQVVVWADAVAEPVAVRYAWANNPRCNLRTSLGLPATPFRSDDWPGITVDVK
jgi:sialate O-acetylesterase